MNKKTVTVAISAFFAGLTAWLGTLAIPVYILVGCNMIDYLTGIMASRKRGEKVSSEIGILGILKKICQWILVIVGWMLDVIIENCVKAAIPGFDVPVVVALFVAFWLVANEMLSILENIDCIGVPIPNFLRKVITYLLHSTEKEAEAAVPDDEIKNLNVEDAGND